MCGVHTFAIADGYFSLPLTKNVNDAKTLIGDKSLFPCVGMVCQACGFTSFHSLAKLGLMFLWTREGPPA